MTKTINIRGKLLCLEKPVVMGIMNVTPDSFYPASRLHDETSIKRRINEIIEEGGTFIDIGAFSTRPGATPVTIEEEWNRLEPALSILRRDYSCTPFSVDTFRADIAKRAVEDFGAAIINDISGGAADEKMFETAASLNVPYILTHIQGMYYAMQQNTDYKNLIEDVMLYFAEKLQLLHLLGINDVIIDPGFGFSKNLEQNYELMRSLKEFSLMLECPLLVGISRKSMIYNVLGCTADESLNGTTVLNTFALLNGADILRVHDVRVAVETIKIINKLKY